MTKAAQERSIRTLAWLGDAHYELAIRRRLSALGDWPVDRLDRVRAELCRAETQAELLAALEATLDEAESSVVARARNASLRSGGRAQRNVRAYRAATALEALVAVWCEDANGDRFESCLGPALDARIQLAFARSEKLKRG